MRRGYDHKQIEAKWQQEWARTGAHRAPLESKKEQYILNMFPYPSGAGLHVGHPRGYVGTDVYARLKRAQGHDVLHPMGWDSFGLPAENYAIKTGTPPQETTTKSIDRFRTQFQMIGMSYDWDREIATSDPTYYRWTQWLFLKLYEHDLAYQKEAPVNWCPSCQTVLANEQVINGLCDRCQSEVIQRNLKQWFFRITKYTDELLEALNGLDWPERIKTIQRNWIGKKEGINIIYEVVDTKEAVTCFTTRPDTNFGATFVVLAPEHPFVQKIVSGELSTNEQVSVTDYVKKSLKKTERERQEEGRTKTGAFTGFSALNHLTNEAMPIWVSDFVLAGFGTGAVVGVPGHDKRDFEFAQAFDLPVRRVVVAPDGDTSEITQLEQVQEDVGTMINSDFLDGLPIHQATVKMMDYLEEKGWGERVTTYRLRDWLVSRQRYWGAPIPIIHCQTCGAVPAPEEQLPIMLPTDVDFRPTGESPIARSKSFHEGVTCPKCSLPARRESDTLDTFVDSSWYFLRFADPNNDREIFSHKSAQTWLPVDRYVGGVEHAVLHLLYARFITKAFTDIGLLEFREPFLSLRNQGFILAEDGRKMSKSLGNVVNPDDVIAEFGADTLRAYEMFMGPFTDTMPWSTRSMVGTRRWLDRVWNMHDRVETNCEDSDAAVRAVEQAVQKVTADIEAFHFNTAISTLMETSNLLQEQPSISRTLFCRYLQLLAPFAPHLASELWEKTGGEGTIEHALWPEADESKLISNTVTLVVQVNGKVRATLKVAKGLDETEALALAVADQRVVAHVGETRPAKVIYVQDKIINLVTG